MHHSKKNRARPQSGTVGASIGGDIAVVKQNARLFAKNLVVPLWRKTVNRDQKKSNSRSLRARIVQHF
jgi:hypothetical protein